MATQSRPIATDDLVRRLQSGDTGVEELKALHALAKEMVKIFGDQRLPSHVQEAAALAPVTDGTGYQNLSRAFGNAVIDGADGYIVDQRLLDAFVSVLRCADGDKTADLQLGPVMESLQTLLEKAVNHADPRSQYRLIRTLSSVLDAMIDRRATGLSREKLHEPLLKQLGTLSEGGELRLAEAACYAHQALLGIPNDESPYRTLWRTIRPVIEGAVKVAGAVPTMDLAKLFDGFTNLAELPALVNSMVDVVKALSGLASSLKSATEAAKLRQKQKSWYVALRFTDMLLSARAFNHLEDFVKKVPCCDEKKFLCGFYAQVERAWSAEDRNTQQQIFRLLDQVLVPAGCKSGHRRIHEWIKLLADTLGQPHWKDKVPPPKPRLRWGKEYKTSIPCWVPNKEPLLADLVNKAWDGCLDAHVFYADVEVRKHYLENEKLKVERLSGKRLPMEQCYINLGVVEQADHIAGRSKQADSKHKSSPFSLLARLKVEAPAQDKQVSLHSLFDARENRDGTTAPPQRILIRGQAGVGKTTLCKRIVYNYLREGVWSDMFDRLLWVPLRTLKASLANNPAYNLEQWFRDKYFRAGDEDKFAKALARTVSNHTQRSRTLFILDGLDEVSRELDSETLGLLHDLLKQPHVIITSRPAGLNPVHIGRVDLELETIGFNQDQVTSYIKMAARQQVADQQDANQQAAEIEAFLQDHSLLQGLVRIPIQLDALCYSWDISTDSQEAPTTMTALYRQIELKLWKKDAARLERQYEGKPLSENTAKLMRDKEIASQVACELALLRHLAFAGLCSDVIEFDQKIQDKIWESWPTETLPSSLSLAKVSFLRSSDTSDQRNQSYHFLHLTFQEFFAAQYFVEYWNSGKKIDVPRLGRSSPEIEPTAEAFLQKEKYKARYDIFWRFVAGLLYEKCDEKQLCQFFRTIDNEPRDLLGPTHQRLVMHCLNEVPLDISTSFAHLRRGLEKQLSRWLLFECSFKDRSSLASEMELPEQVLEEAIREGSEEAKVKILSALRKVSAKAIELAPNWLKDGVSAKLQIAALKIFRPLKNVPPTAFKSIFGRLQDENYGIRQAAVEALAGQAEKLEVFNALIGRLQDKDYSVRQAAGKALAGQATKLEIFNVLISRLQYEDYDVRRAAVEALAGQAEKHEVFDALIDRLQNKNYGVRRAAVGALAGQVEKLEVFNALIGRLQDENYGVRQAAIEALAGQAEKPEVFNALIGRLQDEDSDVRQAAIEALAGQAEKPEVFDALIGRLQDEIYNIRQAAVEALAGQAEKPEIFDVLIGQLQDVVHSVRQAVVEALAGQAEKPEVFDVLIGRLQDKGYGVRQAAVEALAGQAEKPEVFNALIGRLQDENYDVRQAAVEALAGQAEKHEVFDALIGRLQDENYNVRRAAVEALAGQAEKPEIFDALIDRLQDVDYDVRWAAVTALAGQQALSLDILTQNAKSLYQDLLERSFDEHLSWYVDNEICIDMPEGFRTVPFDQLGRFRDEIQKAQETLGIPKQKDYEGDSR